MITWKNDDEMFSLMKEKLYTPVVGDILDQMGYRHQFLPAQIRPLVSQVPMGCYVKDDEPNNRLKVAGYACTVLENDIYGEPKKPFGYMTEALDQLRPNEIYIATGAPDHQMRVVKNNREVRRIGRKGGRRLSRTWDPDGLYNVADIALCTGVGIFVLSSLLRPDLKKLREKVDEVR